MTNQEQEDVQWNSLRERKPPLSYEIYKGIKGKFGVAKFTLKRPWENYNNKKKQEGTVFLKVAPPNGDKTYDYDKSINMSLTIEDLSKLLYYFKTTRSSGRLEIYHEIIKEGSGKAVKVIRLNKEEDKDNYFLQVTEDYNGNKNMVALPISPQEAVALVVLFESAIPTILSWTEI